MRATTPAAQLDHHFRRGHLGIEPQYQEQIFEPFQRLHAVRQFEGTGLGLASCRQIVEAHGGDLRCESQGEGHGSTFVVLLPFEFPAAAPGH